MTRVIPTQMEDVYHDTDDPSFSLTGYAEVTLQGSIIASVIQPDGGEIEVLIENQEGRPVLHAWRTEDYGNDPWLSVYLDTGTLRWKDENNYIPHDRDQT